MFRQLKNRGRNPHCCYDISQSNPGHGKNRYGYGNLRRNLRFRGQENTNTCPECVCSVMLRQTVSHAETPFLINNRGETLATLTGGNIMVHTLTCIPML